VLISRAKSEKNLNKILVREKEYIYNRKLMLADYSNVFQQINELEILKLEKQLENVLYKENILLLD